MDAAKCKICGEKHWNSVCYPQGRFDPPPPAPKAKEMAKERVRVVRVKAPAKPKADRKPAEPKQTIRTVPAEAIAKAKVDNPNAAAVKLWRKRHPEEYAAKMRAYRARKRAEQNEGKDQADPSETADGQSQPSAYQAGAAAEASPPGAGAA